MAEATPRRRWALLAAWSVGVVALAALYGPALVRHAGRSLDPLVYNDDVRVLIFPFFHYSDPELFAHDAISDYYLAGLPEGYRILYYVAAKLSLAVALSKLLPYLLLAATVALLGLAARHVAGGVAGSVAGFGAAALTLGSALFLARMGGGLPRAFAYPLLAAAAAALALGKPRWLAGVVWFGAAFYPVVAVIAGLALALLLVLGPGDRGDAADWSLRRRAAFCGVTAAVAVVLILPAALRLRVWGRQLTPAAVAEYPEVGPGGRFFAEDRAPFPGFLESARRVARRAVMGAGERVLPAAAAWLRRGDGGRRRETALELLLVVAGIGSVRLAVARPEARRMLLLAAAAFAGHLAAGAVVPHLFLPQRYVQYPVPILAILLAATGFAGLAPHDTRRAGSIRAALVVAGNLGLIVVFGGRGSDEAGLTIAVSPDEAQVLRAIAALPKRAVVAGWPAGTLDDVPYVARRAVLLSFETHLPYHEGYTRLARKRMSALIDAYFATSPEPLLRLRDEFGVTDLLVDLDHLRRSPPGYFRPFDGEIRAALRRAEGRPFEVERQARVATAYAHGNSVLLDLSRLAPAP